MTERKFKKELLIKKRELQKSEEDLFFKFKYPFKKNPIRQWIRFPSVIFKFIIRTVISFLPPCGLQILLLKTLGVKIGKNVGISPGIKVDSWFPDLIEIKDNVIIGLDVTILTHDITKSRIKVGKVIIEKNALISANSTICAGVLINENSKVGLGSIITKSTEKNKLYRGYH